MTQFNLVNSPVLTSNTNFLSELEIKGGFAGVMQPTPISELPSESDNDYIDKDDCQESVFEKWEKVWNMAVDFYELDVANSRLPIVIQDLIYYDILENPLIGNYLTGKMSVNSLIYWTVERIEEFVSKTHDAISKHHQSYFPEKYN